MRASQVTLYGLDLFSGIAGITFALAPWVRPIAYCEIDRHASAGILSGIARGQIANAPVWGNVETLTHRALPFEPDIIYGGFPCQDISAAGRGAGLEGERSGLFFEIMRLVDELRPSFLFLENVPAITTRGLGRVTGEITERGYDCRWITLSASDVGACHIRRRWWLLAHARSEQLWLEQQRDKEAPRIEAFARDDGAQGDVANAGGERFARVGPPHDDDGNQSFGNVSDGRRETLADAEKLAERARLCEGDAEKLGQRRSSDCGCETGDSFVADAESIGWGEGQPESEIQRRQSDTFGNGWWAVEPNVGRVANGISFRVDRLRGLGNAVVPLCAREAFKELSGLKE